MSGWKARFHPQAWIRDYAVDVDGQGELEWTIAEGDAARWLAEAESVCPDLDGLRDEPAAPAWIRRWQGPFYVELVAPNGIAVDETGLWRGVSHG